MKSRLGLAIAAMLCAAAPANADVYLYEINAVYDYDPSTSITGSFTMDSSIGPASISNVDIHATLPSVNFYFDGVIYPTQTWQTWPDGGYLWFTNDAYYAGDTYFWMRFHDDTSLNNGSYVIGMGGDGIPHPSEISIAGVHDFQYINGEMTAAPVPLHPLPLLGQMLLMGLAGFGFLAYRRKGKIDLAPFYLMIGPAACRKLWRVCAAWA